MNFIQFYGYNYFQAQFSQKAANHPHPLRHTHTHTRTHTHTHTYAPLATCEDCVYTQRLRGPPLLLAVSK